MARIITVTSGKGGVGKTNIGLNLAITLSSQGKRVCLFDADLGLANVNILLGIYPESNLNDVIAGTKTLSEIVIRNCQGIDIIPGSSGVEKMADLPPDQIGPLVSAFTQLDDYDFMIFDTSAGVARNVIAFCMASMDVILIVTPEPTSLTDGYALLKILAINGYDRTVRVLVNQSKSAKISQLVYTKLRDTVQKFLSIRIAPIGAIDYDPYVTEAVNAQQPFVTRYPSAPASRCVRLITAHLLDPKIIDIQALSPQSFWEKLLDLLRKPIKGAAALPAASVEPAQALPEKAPAIPKPAAASPKPPAASKPAGAQRAATVADAELNSLKVIQQLAEHVGSVSREIGTIRKLLETGYRPVANAPDSTSEPVFLDFDAFVSQHKPN